MLGKTQVMDFFGGVGWGVVVEPPTKFPKRGGGFTRLKSLEGVAGKEGGGSFRGGEEGCNCHIENKLKSEIFNDKKSYKQKYFLRISKNIFITKNSNWEILTKNLVTFKR